MFAVGWTVFCWKAGWQDTVLQSLNHCTESQPCWQDPILRKFTVLSNTCCCHWMILCKIWNSIYWDPYLISFIFFSFFFHPLQSPEPQMTAVKPFPKSIIQYSAWCQDNSSYRVKIHSSDFALMQRCQDSTGYKDIQAFLQCGLCKVTQVRRPSRLWLQEAQPPFLFSLKALVVQPDGRWHYYKSVLSPSPLRQWLFQDKRLLELSWWEVWFTHT